jgi:thiol-disulfide isomerase/thioredoxin
MLLGFGSCKKESKLSIEFPDKYEGKTVELIEYMDSTILATTIVKDGKAEFITTETDGLKFPFFTQVAVDGKTQAYYIAEPGNAIVSDSTFVAVGTPMNNKLERLMARLDSVDDLDNMPMYIDFVESEYNANKKNVLAGFLGVEFIKFADPNKVDSFLNVAPATFKSARRVKFYENRARLRLATAPGMKYSDILGENEAGKPLKLSQLVESGSYTLVDMWASWCPYCIRELPELKEMYAEFSSKGFDIVGVAVRDLPDDTRQMVAKQELPWKVLYNTQKAPYDIYGFSGIPHHILIGPDGTIISRGENADQIKERLSTLLK